MGTITKDRDMIDWEYSRTQMCHHGYVFVNRESVFMHIRPTNRTQCLIGSIRAKDGYDLFEGKYGEESKLLKHGKTVKILKEFAEIKWGL